MILNQCHGGPQDSLPSLELQSHFSVPSGLKVFHCRKLGSPEHLLFRETYSLLHWTSTSSFPVNWKSICTPPQTNRNDLCATGPVSTLDPIRLINHGTPPGWNPNFSDLGLLDGSRETSPRLPMQSSCFLGFPDYSAWVRPGIQTFTVMTTHVVKPEYSCCELSYVNPALAKLLQ